MAFTGRAVYSNFTAIKEDVADLVSIISPRETPLLDFIGDPMREGFNILHEWEEDELAPNTVVASSNVASAATDTVMGVASGKAPYLQIGMIVMGPSGAGSEYMVISAISGNSITLQRGFGGTTPNSFAAGQSLTIIADAALEGDDVTQDSSTVRVRKNNYRHTCSLAA